MGLTRERVQQTLLSFDLKIFVSEISKRITDVYACKGDSAAIIPGAQNTTLR